MAYSVMKLGDAGEDVRTLRSLLRGAGFKLEDGDVFDEETTQAVSEYQKANGLPSTGEAGANTWARLAAGVVTSMPSDLDTPGRVAYLETNRPGDYVSDYAAEIDRLLEQILSREAFSYDPATDPMYQRYKDQYMYMGKRAMNDAIGQASALSGGYANSYAQSAGQQAYQDYLAKLTGGIPDLYELALKAYDAQTGLIETQLSALTDAEKQAYQRYLDELDAYNDALDYYYKKMLDEQKYARSRGGSSDERVQQGTLETVFDIQPNILTQSEFTRRKQAGASSLSGYKSYQDYVNAMKKKY